MNALEKLLEEFDESYRDLISLPEEARRGCMEALEQANDHLTKSPSEAPESEALVAYMLFLMSRIPAAAGRYGSLLSLRRQDRALWDRSMIDSGLEHLKRSARGNSVTVYHLKAGVEACHSLSEDYESTDWGRIISLYDGYLEVNNSSDVALQRALLLAEAANENRAIEAIEELLEQGEGCDCRAMYSSLGDLYMKIHRYGKARDCYDSALRGSGSETQSVIVRRKLRTCSERLRFKENYRLVNNC